MANPGDATSFAKRYMATLAGVLDAMPADDIGRALEVLEDTYRRGKTLFVAGNGGSAATASHMANDLLWGIAQIGKPGMRVIALSDNVPVLTAIANDRGYDDVFSVQLEAHASAGDVLLVITGSGNSPNILRAVETAAAKGLVTIGFLGKGGGKVRPLLRHAVVVPSDDYGPIEDLHMMLDHLLIAGLRERLRDA